MGSRFANLQLGSDDLQRWCFVSGCFKPSRTVSDHHLQTDESVLILGVMRKQLTTKLLDSLQPATAKRYEVRDTLLVGLLVRVSKRGSKIWYVMPRVTGKPKRIKIGTYPILSLADARERARSLLRDAQLGLLTETAIKAEAAKLAKLETIIPQFIELYAKPRNRDWQETSRLLTKFKPSMAGPLERSGVPRLCTSWTNWLNVRPTEPTGPFNRSRSCTTGALTVGQSNSALSQA